MTFKANDLVREIREDLIIVDRSLRVHPYPQAFRNGKAPIEALVPFIGHQYHLSHTDIRSMALLVNHFDDGPASSFFRGLLDGELAGLRGILVMAEAMGLSEAQLQAYEPGAEGFAYGAYVNLLANNGTAAEVVCGFLVNLAAWGFNCGELGHGLRDHYGWSERATAFVDGFAAVPALDDEALPIIQAGLDQGTNPMLIKRAARLIQSYEKLFWDAMLNEAKLGRIAQSA